LKVSRAITLCETPNSESDVDRDGGGRRRQRRPVDTAEHQPGAGDEVDARGDGQQEGHVSGGAKKQDCGAGGVGHGGIVLGVQR